jgi:transcription antitermination factor NusG
MDRYETLKTGHIANILEVLDQETLITELKQIQTAIHLDAPLQPFPFVRKGRKVEIVDGPFAGLTGIVQRAKKMGRLNSVDEHDSEGDEVCPQNCFVGDTY